MPMAASRLNEVVEMAGISETSRSPRRMIDPLQNLFSMPDRAASIALPRSTVNRSSAMTYISCSRSFSHSRRSALSPGRQIAGSITHPAREWNSVSHLQHDYFHRRVGVNQGAIAALSASKFHWIARLELH